MTVLSVNLNKIALLRNSRGRDVPNVVAFGEKAILAGAQGLTIHPRPDQRHAKYDDIAPLKLLCDKHNVELNIEGYPVPELIDLCIEHRVHQVTLVPDAPDQVTSDHGWHVSQARDVLAPVIERLKTRNIRVSLFMDTDLSEIEQVATVNADRIELHTEPYARAFENQAAQDVISEFVTAFDVARGHGLGVNAGHDLTLENLPFFLKHIRADEVSIGHALTIESLEHGWTNVIEQYAAICQGEE